MFKNTTFAAFLAVGSVVRKAVDDDYRTMSREPIVPFFCFCLFAKFIYSCLPLAVYIVVGWRSW